MNKSRRTRVPLVREAVVVVALAITAGACAPKIKVAKQATMTQPEGKQAPDFVAVDHRGKEISLAREAANSVVALVFYRGHW